MSWNGTNATFKCDYCKENTIPYLFKDVSLCFKESEMDLYSVTGDAISKC